MSYNTSPFPRHVLSFRAWLCSVILGDTTLASNPTIPTADLEEGLRVVVASSHTELLEVSQAIDVCLATSLELSASSMHGGAMLAALHYTQALAIFNVIPSKGDDGSTRYLCNEDAECGSTVLALSYWLAHR